MDSKVLERFRSSLSQHRDELMAWLDQDYDQKSIRLGNASIQNVLQVVLQLEDALEKLDKGNFGMCEVCHEDVETTRLELDYTTTVCLEHLSEEQIQALEKDLEMVGQVQRELLPRTAPQIPELDIAVATQPARIVGGDYYDFFTTRQDQTGIVIADVMGKGLPASMLMSNLQACLRILGPESEDPISVTRRLNKLFLNNVKLIRFISIFIGIFQPETKKLIYCNAGHHPPLLWENSSRQIHLLSPTGPAIGLSATPEYRESSVPLHSDDILLLYTDGIVEARNQMDEEFGENRLSKFLQTHHQQTASEIVGSLLTRLKLFSQSFQDDVTLLAIKVK